MAHFSDTNLNAQRARLFDALQSAGVDGITTIQARHELNILAPAPRVFELRHDYGKNIRTVWAQGVTPEGYSHRIARYVLLPGNWKGASV